LHYLPRFDDFVLSCASNMETASATLEITLNAATIHFLANITCQFISGLRHLPANSCDIVVSEPNFRSPVDADNVSPS
jgi:hypothetical protein